MERLNIMDSVVASLNDGEATFIMTASPKGQEYVYSVGVSVSTNNPFEIVITGLSPEQMHYFGNHFAQHIKERVIELDEPITYVEEVFNVPVALVKVSQEHMYDGTFTVAETTLDMTDKQIPMFQLVLPDPNGRFPWQEHVDSKWKKYQSIFFDVQQIEKLIQLDRRTSISPYYDCYLTKDGQFQPMNSYVFPCSKRAGSYFIQIPTVWSEKATDSEYFSTSRYESPKASAETYVKAQLAYIYGDMRAALILAYPQWVKKLKYGCQVSVRETQRVSRGKPYPVFAQRQRPVSYTTRL